MRGDDLVLSSFISTRRNRVFFENSPLASVQADMFYPIATMHAVHFGVRTPVCYSFCTSTI